MPANLADALSALEAQINDTDTPLDDYTVRNTIRTLIAIARVADESADPDKLRAVLHLATNEGTGEQHVFINVGEASAFMLETIATAFHSGRKEVWSRTQGGNGIKVAPMDNQ
jgi:hypothetical protein